tara:strand:- start:1603 stop:1974 length:372 start_codon:yes stop_codon:yes gene_type:complete
MELDARFLRGTIAQTSRQILIALTDVLALHTRPVKEAKIQLEIKPERGVGRAHDNFGVIKSVCLLKFVDDRVPSAGLERAEQGYVQRRQIGLDEGKADMLPGFVVHVEQFMRMHQIPLDKGCR